MPAATPINHNCLPDDLRQFIDSFPDADAIRERLEHNSHEAKFLKRLLRLAVDAEQVRNQGAVA